MDLLEQAHRKATKMLKGLELVSYEDRLRELALFKRFSLDEVFRRNSLLAG